MVAGRLRTHRPRETVSRASRVIASSDAGQTVAAIVRALVPGASWNKARELCASGRVTIDGEIARNDALRVSVGQTVEVDPHAKRQLEGTIGDDDILFSDADVIVVRKPPGILTCPYEDGDRGTLVDRVRAYLRRTTQTRDPVVGVVQRLDKDTSGILVFARSMRGKRALEAQLRAHTVLRRYVAIVNGVVRGEATIRSEIVPDRGDGLRGSWGTRPSHRGDLPSDAKHAVTHVRAIEALHGATLLECKLETGRQHQIRIHLSEAGHPLVGEPVYIRDYTGPRISAPRPMLHARELGFEHPADGRSGRWEDPPPADFEGCLGSLRAR
jgi:23S rRNA pseudouridine1911/1915/1917 synthase